ncbi:hypothetical protein JGU66_25485 [Myxococcaceae bacterium JPH2]|nr:hypothetical protein [Myxococcaceae bacterium JPH2]
MNLFGLSLERVVGEERKVLDGIHFSNAVFVRVFIDGDDIGCVDPFRGSVVVFDELEKSVGASGNYLIFTCACGVAEDGGWEGVEVMQGESTVSWNLDVGEGFRFVFERSNYVGEITSIKRMLDREALPLVPSAVIFPENFKR